ncbi:FtsX-like permease family protein [Trueperella pyogenes]|uniref:FtsX-like permease family protein n=1 Tax=Trueperella pyogenes TaxID=1661 RepID=UPI000F851F1C|nr:FtsX-like permease family protein [Trueperella pyogenes]AZR02631.1 FtsX-like permease family protein [Trueperella pyogenes]MDF2420547.1 FtsX-like permease family protein [Trueperella pyogenes]
MNTLQMAGHLAISRIRNARGHALLDSLAVLAFSVSSWLLLTTMGGVWMFYGRKSRLSDMLYDSYSIPRVDTAQLGGIYMSLAVLALALLIIPLLSLGSSAARLGTGGRAKRLASLRLIGLTAGQINVMTLVETMIQGLVGFAIGLIVYLVSLGGWSQVTFTTLNIRAGEMMLPWWGFLIAIGLITLITLGSTLVGLRRVAISPLGVARRETPKALKYWRVIGIVVVLPALVVSMRATKGNIVISSLFFMMLFLTISIAGPLFIQMATRPLVRTASPAKLLGVRRVLDDPRAAWRNVSAISLMALIASIVVFGISITLSGNAPDPTIGNLRLILISDITKGVTIALAFALILGATSTLIHQAADVFDRADESLALTKMGLSRGVLLKARLWQVVPPLLLMLGVTIGVGAILGLATGNTPRPENYTMLMWVVRVGITLTVAAVVATVPIQARILSHHSRKND